MIKAVSGAVQYMAKRRIGALIVFEKKTGLQDYIETGIPMDSDISQELLTNVFIPNTPLHDGAMIIQGTKIASAACYLPLSDSSKYLKLRYETPCCCRYFRSVRCVYCGCI